MADEVLHLKDTKVNLKSKVALVHDSGLFPWLAVCLAKSFGRVLYYKPWETAFSQRNQLKVGEGLPGVERVEDWESHVKHVDCWVFPDIHFPERQHLLQDMGKRVWGSRYGEELELYRPQAKRRMKALGMDIGDYEVIKGTAKLRDYLKAHKDVWVKGSKTRGDFESFQAENYTLIEPMIDKLDHSLGLDADDAEFVVEKSIHDAIELATDIYSIDGKFPKSGMLGVEDKAKGYLGRFLRDTQWPRQFRVLNQQVSDDLKKWQFRNFFAVEVRVTKDGTPWVLDPAMRSGSPPSELQQVMYTNLAEIIWQGSGGICIDPIPADNWGAELILYSSWAEDNWQPIHFPPEIEPYITLRYCSKIKGKYAVRPQHEKLSHIGSVSAVGPTAKAAIEKCKEYAEQVKGIGVECYPESLDRAMEKFKQLPDYKLLPETK